MARLEAGLCRCQPWSRYAPSKNKISIDVPLITSTSFKTKENTNIPWYILQCSEWELLYVLFSAGSCLAAKNWCCFCAWSVVTNMRRLKPTAEFPFILIRDFGNVRGDSLNNYARFPPHSLGTAAALGERSEKSLSRNEGASLFFCLSVRVLMLQLRRGDSCVFLCLFVRHYLPIRLNNTFVTQYYAGKSLTCLIKREKWT